MYIYIYICLSLNFKLEVWVWDTKFIDLFDLEKKLSKS